MLQAGVPELNLRLWSGLFAPAATPEAIVERLAKEVTAIVAERTCESAWSGWASTPAAARAPSSPRKLPPKSALDERCQSRQHKTGLRRLGAGMSAREPAPEATAADVMLASLRQHGVEFFFANPGTDFPPIVEGFRAGPDAAWGGAAADPGAA
jgi:hypothetical protein